LVAAALLIASTSAALLFAQSEDKGVMAQDANPRRGDEPRVILHSKSDRWGSYNVSNGTNGPFWSAQGIWNASTKRYENLTFATGSNIISGFSSTQGLARGMTVGVTPEAFAPETTIVSVGENSIVVSQAAKRDGKGEAGVFGLANDGVMFNQVITNYPLTFPRGTTIEWSYPSLPNDAAVYAFAIIAGYGIGTGGHFRPANAPPPKKVSEFTELSVTYDVSVTGDPNDFNLLVETFPTTGPRPSAPNVENTMTNEIGFMPHVPDFAWTYISGFSDHFDYSSPDGTFHAYVATKPGNAFTAGPPFTMIVPVTEAGGRKPRDMMRGTQTLPLLGVLRELVARGIIPADSYVSGFDLGFEITRNSGRAVLNDIAWKWQ
jgi:hypothetical protein